MATVQDVLNAARSLLGIGETPPRSNIAHPITDWAAQYGYSAGDAWCAWKVSFDIWHVDPALLQGMAPTGYSGAFRAWGEKYGRLLKNPVPGCIDVMNFDSDPSFTDHVGIVESVHSGYWTCIEGNHKDQVARENRSFADGQHWFVMPYYSAAPIQKTKTKETEMALVTSGVPVKSFAGIFQVGVMGGEPWDVWAKVQNPTPNPIKVRFVCVTDNTHEEKTIDLPGNKLAQMQGKDLKASSNSLMVVEPSIPCICTFDHRPTK